MRWELGFNPKVQFWNWEERKYYVDKNKYIKIYYSYTREMNLYIWLKSETHNKIQIQIWDPNEIEIRKWKRKEHYTTPSKIYK